MQLNCNFDTNRVTTKYSQLDTTMTGQDPKRFQSQRMPTLTLLAIIIYFGVGYPLVNKFWPNSDTGLWVLIVIGLVGGYLFKRRQRQRDQGV